MWQYEAALFRCLVLSRPLLGWPFSPSASYHGPNPNPNPALTKAHNREPKPRTVLLPVHVLSLFVVSVSPKPKEPGAAVVAPGRSSAQPPVRQGLRCCWSWSGPEVRGGERVVFSSHLFSSSLWRTGLLTALSNQTRVCFCGRENKKETKSRRGTETTNFYTRFVCLFISKKMPWCSEIPLQDNVHILVYVWCSSFVQYIVLVKFFALPTCIYL